MKFTCGIQRAPQIVNDVIIRFAGTEWRPLSLSLTCLCFNVICSNKSSSRFSVYLKFLMHGSNFKVFLGELNPKLFCRVIPNS
jgi:hypothetical protein